MNAFNLFLKINDKFLIASLPSTHRFRLLSGFVVETWFFPLRYKKFIVESVYLFARIEIFQSSFLTSFFLNFQAEGIIKRHTQHRRIQREQDPTRFKIKPTLADLAFRNSPRENKSNNNNNNDNSNATEDSSSSAAPLGDTATVLQSLTSN